MWFLQNTRWVLLKWDQDQKLVIVMLTVCTGHVLLVLTGFLVGTSASSFFPFECLPNFSPLFFLPSFCIWFCMSGPWFSSSALFCLFCVPPCLYSLLKHDHIFLFSIIKDFSLHALCFLYLILSVLFSLNHSPQFTSLVSQDHSDTACQSVIFLGC